MFLMLLTVACTGETTDSVTTADSPSTEVDTETGTTPENCDSPDPQVVTLTTRDGVALVGDLYAHSGSDHPSVVLLHMIPPNYQRTDWPREFIDGLTSHCWNLIAIDRRGSGDSGGTASEAYTGETGRYDVEAAVKRLQDAGLGKLGIIGASNGTTSMIDYTSWSAGEGLPVPVVHGFMTGGSYTEAQNAMSTVATVPSVFTYSTAEKAWSVDQQGLDPGSWLFEEYADGDHGTKMFDAEPSVSADLEGFFAIHL
jgi:predicted alpha/beta-fold hydrolase